MGTLTYKEMEEALRNGGSVLYKGEILSHPSQLPSEADLAAGNPEQEAAASAALEAQIASLTAAKARLDLGRQPLIPPTPQPGTGNVSGGGQTEHPFVAIAGQETTDRLIAAGYGTPEAVARASDEELRAIKGVGEATLKRLREAKG